MQLSFFGRLCRLTAFWLGKSPHTWYRWFTVKAMVLFTVRYNVYRSKQWHYYMLEFCYFANVLLLVQIWVLPNWPWMYKASPCTATLLSISKCCTRADLAAA